jgi:long-chain acyl-CoA synthetase
VSPLGDRFARVCRDNADTVAVYCTDADGHVTFAELARACAALGRGLADCGIGPGTAVVSALGNHSMFFAAFVACFDAGAALVPLGEATNAEVVALVGQLGAAAVITDRDLPLRYAREHGVASGVRVLRLAEATDREPYLASIVLKLTSGSISHPKAAVASAEQMINDGRHIIDAMGIGPTDVNVACIPLSHSYALGNIVMPLVWQGSPVLLRRSFNPVHLLRDVEAVGATVFAGVPFMYERIKTLDGIETLPSCLRLLISAGARIDPETVVWFRRRLDRKVHSFYGSSETGGITYDDSDDVRDPLDVGRTLPETTISIRNAGDGAAGRIFVEGNAVTAGYAHGGYDDSVSAYVDGGFLTGDLGYRDGAGRLVLTGRVSPFVNVASRKVDPAEVEHRLLELPGVAEARVLGVASDTRGQDVVAFVVCSDRSWTPISLRQRCAETLATYKIPRRFIFVDRLPVDARGKVDRRALQDLALGTGGD